MAARKANPDAWMPAFLAARPSRAKVRLREGEPCGILAAGGYEGPGRSPDRADALVWALWELMLGTRSEPRVRVL